MAADFAETMGELRDLLNDMRRDSEGTMYGIFCGTDPRQFSPDPEASTEAEREAHRVDCERAERGEPRLTETACVIEPTFIMSRSGYGLGVTTQHDEELADKCERLERIIAQLDGYAPEEE